MKSLAFLPVLIVVLLMVLFSSCSKDEDPVVEPENQAPVLTLDISNEAGTVWNTVDVTVNASDGDGGIETVELWIDNEKIGETTQSEYTFQWNTRDFDDGTVTVKAIATDDKGLQSAQEQEIEILNTLMNISIPEGYLIETFDMKYYVYITNQLRQVIYFSQIEEEPFQAIVERPESFDDATFDLHFLAAKPDKGEMISYTGITPGDFNPGAPTGNGEFLRFANVSFWDVPEHDFFQFNHHAGFILEEDHNYSIPVFDQLDFAYLYLRNGENGIYTFVENITAHDPEVSLQTTPFMMDRKEFSVGTPSTLLLFEARAHTGNSFYSPSVELFTAYSGQPTDEYSDFYHVPSNEPVFMNYSSKLTVLEDNTYYINEHFKSLGTSLQKLNANFMLDGTQLNNINLSISGEDYDHVVAFYEVDAAQVYFEWECHGKGEDLEFPPIPVEVTQAFGNLSSSAFIFHDAKVRVEVRDYDHIDGFDQYWQRVSGRNSKHLHDGASVMISTGEVFD
ncbi:MAG: Ig-like domain-containing protein [Bacteroidota bacterium]